MPVMLVHIIVVLVVVGLILYLIKAYVPMDPPIQRVLDVVVVVVLILWLLSITGLLGDYSISRPLIR